MLAYIIFLLICVVYYYASTVFKFEFSEWNRIVVAVTISSYFFSMSTLYKYDYETTKREARHLDKCFKVFEKAKNIDYIYNKHSNLDETISMIKEKKQAIRTKKIAILNLHICWMLSDIFVFSALYVLSPCSTS